MKSRAKIFFAAHCETRYATVEKQHLALTYRLDKNHSSHVMEYQIVSILIILNNFRVVSSLASSAPRSCGFRWTLNTTLIIYVLTEKQRQ